MKVITVKYADFQDAKVVTPEMVVQIAKALGMTDEAIAKLQAQKLSKASGGKGGRSSGAADLPDAKLRTVVNTKLSNQNDYVTGWGQGAQFDFEFHGANFQEEAPEPDINAAGANKQRKARATGQRAAGGVQKGKYRVVKQGLKCTMEQDPEKFKLWQFVWTCGSFEEYYAKAPAKAITRTGRIITAASEMAWALKSGWIVPVQEGAAE